MEYAKKTAHIAVMCFKNLDFESRCWSDLSPLYSPFDCERANIPCCRHYQTLNPSFTRPLLFIPTATSPYLRPFNCLPIIMSSCHLAPPLCHQSFFLSKLVNSKWVVGDRWHCLPVLSSWCQFPPVVTPSVQRLPRASPIRVSVTNQGGRRDPGEGRPLLNPGPRGSVVEKPDHTPKPPWSTHNRF